MRLGVADARRRFREVLERIRSGETVEITRRDTVIAVVGPPSPSPVETPFAEALRNWREEWEVDTWSDEDLFADVRSPSLGRAPPTGTPRSGPGWNDPAYKHPVPTGTSPQRRPPTT